VKRGLVSSDGRLDTFTAMKFQFVVFWVMKMEVARSSETLVSYIFITLCHMDSTGLDSMQ
jgi:hypothetical protein